MPPRKLTLIPVGAAAARVSLNPRTIRRYIDIGKLRAYRVGDRSIRVDQADVDALVRPVPTAAAAGMAADGPAARPPALPHTGGGAAAAQRDPA